MVDHAHLAWRCTCPSRSHPCKHALALLVMWVKGQVPAAVATPGTRAWVDGHARREAAAGADRARRRRRRRRRRDEADDEPTPAPDGPRDLDASATSASPGCWAGLVELDRWLDDRLRTGLADPALARYATWDDLAARLVDARAGALANRVRRLAGVVGARPDWHEVVLAELGVLHLLAEAGQRVPELPGGLADAVATACGWQVRQADVLAGVPDTDRWVVAGRSDTREDRIEVRRTWLRGAGVGARGRWSCRSPPTASRSTRRSSWATRSPPTSTATRAASWRALVGTRHERRPSSTRSRRRRATSPARAPRSARRSPPSRGSTACRSTLVATPTFDGGRWLLTDDGGSLALAPDAPGSGRRCSPRRRATRSRSTVEWTLDGAVPLTVHLPDRALDVGPRADLSFVSAA